MIVRALNSSHDWTFGNGIQNYLVNQAAIAQDINTRLSSFLGDCFFDLSAGIDWFNLLGSTNSAALIFAINTVIMNTDGVTNIITFSYDLNDVTRNISINYTVQTIYSVLSGNYISNLGSVING